MADNSVLLSSIFSDPEPRETCRRWRQRKIKNRWVTGECGAEATTVLRTSSDDDARLPLCRECVAELIQYLVDHLV
jgi:hypothetical protein